MKTCWNCGWEWEETRQPGMGETCPDCFAYIHCCKNCKLYEPTVHNECRSHTSDFVADKAGRNFCEEFLFVVRELVNDDAVAKQSSNARDKFNKLFGDSSGATAESSDDPKTKFYKLFADEDESEEKEKEKTGVDKLLADQAKNDPEKEKQKRLRKHLGGESS